MDVVAPEDRPELRHPLDALVAQVPQQPEGPTRAQHPRHLGGGPTGVHPVPHLGADHDVDVTVVDRQFLGAPGPHIGARHARLEHGPHVGVGLDRHDVEPPRHEIPRQRARPRPEVQHPPPTGPGDTRRGGLFEQPRHASGGYPGRTLS